MGMTPGGPGGPGGGGGEGNQAYGRLDTTEKCLETNQNNQNIVP